MQVAHTEGRDFLYEYEVYELLRNLGAETIPKVITLLKGTRLSDEEITSLPGESVVMKILSPTIVHKSELGGVKKIEKSPEKIRAASRKMITECAENYASWLEKNAASAPPDYNGLDKEDLNAAIARDIKGVLLCQYMPAESRSFGHELLVGVRDTREFGMILNAGLGGTETEVFSANFRKGRAFVASSTVLANGETFFELFRQTISYKKLAGKYRGQKRIVTDEQLLECFSAFIQVANYYSRENPQAPFFIEEMEINPFAFNDYLMVPLDGMCRFSLPRTPSAFPARPVGKIDYLLHPSCIGIMGVSARKINFGRMILNNIVANGFDKSQIYIIRPGLEQIDGVHCYADFSSLPKKLDLLILAVSADQVPKIVDEIIDSEVCRSVILIPGGLGETRGSEQRTRHLLSKIQQGHLEQNNGPVFLGANSMGVISHPGRYDSLFISPEKFPRDRRSKSRRNSAFISQSGAFLVTRMSKIGIVDPAYMVSIGNQTDLTITDMLSYIKDCPDIDVIAIYMEGFKPLDGQRFCTKVREAVLKGKEVLFYKAGKTPEGKMATSGHTASVAGDYMVCESCVSQSGAMVASNFEEFNDLFCMAAKMHHKKISGKRMAAVSSAGFEAVGMADSIAGDDYNLKMAVFGRDTENELRSVFQRNRLQALVEIKNPMDINPAADENVHNEVAELILKDPNVDCLVLSINPLSPAMCTLFSDAEQQPESRNSIVNSIPLLCQKTDKPIIGVVDGGRLYDPFVDILEKNGLLVFRSADKAVFVLAKYIKGRLKMYNIQQDNCT